MTNHGPLLEEVTQLLVNILQIEARKQLINTDTPLLGAMPEFDSMAVIAVITGLEDYYGVVIDDEEITADIFTTLGTLHQFIVEKVTG